MGERYNILFGGPAGTGPNFLTGLMGSCLVKAGYNVFYSRDYQSLIRGGHNFNVLTFSNEDVSSNDSEIDVIVAFDGKTKEIHKKILKKGGIILSGKDSNAYFAGKLFRILNLDFEVLNRELKKISRRYKENLENAKRGYGEAEKSFDIKKPKKKENKDFINGTQGIAKGGIKSGLDVYFAYPMTPATSLLGELAKNQEKENRIVLELENEIAVANAGVGSTITGAKTMVGTSGGGLDLMSETISLTGMAKVPLVFYLAMRKGPATGVATYNSQEDLKMALNTGHGEFPRIVVSPGDPLEAQEITNQALYLSQKFQTPSIIISDKHLGESFYCIQGKASLVKVPRATKPGRYTSYEQNLKTGSATEEPDLVNKGAEERLERKKKIYEESKKFDMYKIYGKKSSKNVVLFWGSTKGAILDAIRGLDVKAIQILYFEPFPKEVKKSLKDKNLLIIENDSEGQLNEVLKKEILMEVPEKNKILRYDARPFLRDELIKEIKKRLK
jgi:2-oxoglutarate/2-oxoacid ferredoxin oxidoreductase subunit alpha